MIARLATFCLGLALIGGCAESNPSMSMSMPPRAKPAPEMQMLKPLLGSWVGQAQMVSPSREEMMKHMPKDAPPMPESFASAGRAEWAMGGLYMKNEGWYDMGGEKVNFIEWMTWDPKARKFHSWYFNDYGEIGEGWMTFSADGKTANTCVCGTRSDGKEMKGSGTMTIGATGHHEWTWTEHGPGGEMKMKGTNTHSGA
ncbi:MAG: hypothetical protein U1A27_03810 [Phycisphaerae bacterium]